MTQPAAFIAIDLGAESGRVMLGILHEDRVFLHQAHRFPHFPVHLPTGLHWNILGIFSECMEGLKNAAQLAHQHHATLVSLGIDAWGVDYALLDAAGDLLAAPYAYRDARTQISFDSVLQSLGSANLYRRTGIQLMPINTLFQLAAHHHANPDLLKRAHALLFIPDLLHYFLTGSRAVEATIASTSQLIDPRTGLWDASLLHDLGIPSHFLLPTSPPASRLAPILPHIADLTDIPASLPIILPASHDTASAVAAVPVPPGSPSAYLSSGTWSLLGSVIPSPLLTDAALASGFTNELGLAGFRFLKNIAGLWLIQQCRLDLQQRGCNLSYEQLTAAADQSPPFQTLINPDHPPFLQPGNIIDKITAFAQHTGQPVPTDTGPLIRCCLESLALAYHRTFHTLQQTLHANFPRLHIMGGGSQNQLLNRMTADALDLPVTTGPVEATAIGNVLAQALGAGIISSTDHFHRIIERSFPITTTQPRNPQPWQQATHRFADLVRNSCPD